MKKLSNANKTMLMVTLGVFGVIGLNSKVNAQVYEEVQIEEYRPVSENVHTISSSGHASGYNTQAQPMNRVDPGAPKTRQQVIGELMEARKNGLLDVPETEYPQKWVEYQNHLAYGTPYQK